MRRGHSGIGGWRNENPGYYRPRGGANPHYRPQRSYLFDLPRFPEYGPRGHKIPHFTPHLRPPIQDQERNKYRYNGHKNYNRPHERRNDKYSNSLSQYSKHGEISSHKKNYIESNYYEKPMKVDPCHINSLGDIDDRHPNICDRLVNRKHLYNPWKVPPEIKTPHHDERNVDRSYQQPEEINKTSLLDYPSHRPPASDYYGGNPTPTIDNSNTFSRSVDDTVNIVRKKLLDRNESAHTSDNVNIKDTMENLDGKKNSNRCHSIQQEHPTKRRVQRQRQNDKSNCDIIKKKIVHQLFQMDKGKLHKLMDNPNSSSKFEYAISSLIMESQNSFNRHLRSVAEKSLCSSTTDFIQINNNTIYEDTFMKEMQCLLDPQDTVFLEDIKPIVMAELSKVLQLDEFEHRFIEEESTGSIKAEQPYYKQYPVTSNDCDNYPGRIYKKTHTDTDFRRPEIAKSVQDTQSHFDNSQYENLETSSSPFYERSRRDSCGYNKSRISNSENEHFSKISQDNNFSDNIYDSIENTVALFDANAEQFSEEEYPFDELDNQYHVAVDHNFIANDDMFSPQHSIKRNRSKSPNGKTEIDNTLDNTLEKSNIKQEIDDQILNIAKSPLSFTLSGNIEDDRKKWLDFEQSTSVVDKVNTIKDLKVNNMSVDKEEVVRERQNLDFKQSTSFTDKINNTEYLKSCNTPIHKSNDTSLEAEKSQNSCQDRKTITSHNSCKRAINQRPSHRKEKRKKIESTLSDTGKQILNKNIIINVSDCAAKTTQACDSATNSVFNLFLSTDGTDCKTKEMSKENKKIDLVDKEYSVKYVKRKSEKKPEIKHNEPRKKCNSTSPITSALNTKDKSGSNSVHKLAQSKNMLKSIDMFQEQPKKEKIIQAHRNTTTITKGNKETNNMPVNEAFSPKTKHAATQVVNTMLTKETQTCESTTFISKSCQTEKNNLVVHEVQTDSVHIVKSNFQSTDVFERMKEIDVEIQVLLGEKFKLYSSLENKDTSQNALQTLGMTVLNITPFADDTKDESCENDFISEDAIVADFTNIPVEELQHIAFESVEVENSENLKVVKRSRRQAVLEREQKSLASPKGMSSNNNVNKKTKTPNISLIEQIISDDRPLEDIISLNELEKPIKSRINRQKSKQNKRKKQKIQSKKIINSGFDIKECSVVLVRQDLNKILETKTYYEQEVTIDSLYQQGQNSDLYEIVEYEEKENNPEVNDVQFDMLDVSEDIVIGDNCEIKLIEDKEEFKILEISVNENVILDNSQSSSEEVLAPQTINTDNECKIFDYAADENLRRDVTTVTGNPDAILAIECIENNFLAASRDGNVYYYSGDGQLINILRGSNLAVTCFTIVKEQYGTTVYTGSLDSRIRYYDLELGLEKGPECNVLSPIQTMDRAWDTVFVGTNTGFVLQFECKNNLLIPVSTVKFSEQSILALRAMKEGPRKVLLVAARSENVTVKDAQTGLLLRTLDGPKMTVYTLLYEDGKVFCGTSSHQIHVFDYTSGSHVGSHEGGKGAICLRASGGLLFAGCYDGCIYVYREGEARPFAQLYTGTRGPRPMLLSLAIVGSKIIAGYKDRNLYIWKIPLTILQEMIL